MSNLRYAKYGNDGLQAQNPDDSAQAQLIYIGAWAGRPVGTTVPAGAEMICTDVGSGGRSRWIWDPTFSAWRPQNGRVLLYQRSGSVATPVATLTESTAATNYVLSQPLLIPKGLLFIGAKLATEFTTTRVAVAGTPGIQDSVMRLGPLNTASDLSVVAAAALGGINGNSARINGYVKVPFNYTTALYCSYRNAPNNLNNGTGNMVDRTIDITQDLYASFGQTGDGGGDTSTYGLTEYSVWLEA